MALDAEYKKLLAGDSWAQDGDRTDPEDTSVQPVLDRGVGFPSSYSTTETPARSRVNQIFRELYGAAKELRMGVSGYDSSVDYPVNAIVQHLSRLWRATTAHDSSAPVAPATSGQSVWAEVSTTGVITRGVPDTIPNSDVLIDSDDGSSFRVYWNAPNDNNDAITQYDIRYAKNDSGFSNPDGITERNNYTQGDLIDLNSTDDEGESDIFYVQVRARNGQGTGAYPTTAGKRVRSSPLVPELIKYFTAVPGDGMVTLTWYAPFMRGMELSKYVIEWKGPGDSTYTRTGNRHKDVTSGTVTNITGLTNNSTYTFRISTVTTRNTSANGLFDVSATPRVPDTSPSAPSAPINLTAIKGNGSDVIAYTTTIPNNNGAKITSFVWEMRVEAKDGQPANAWASPPSPNSATTEVPYNRFTNLDLGNSLDNVWEIRMKARNSAGDSAPSNVAKRSPVYPRTPSKPTIGVEGRVTPSAGGGTIAYITEDFSDNGADITDIEWQRKLKSEADTAWLRVSPNDTSPFIYTRTETVGAQVQYRVRAKNSAGTGPWSDVQEVQAPGDVPSSPAVPTIAFVNAVAISNDSVGRPRALVYMISDIESISTISRVDWQYKLASSNTWLELKRRGGGLNRLSTIADGGIMTAGMTYQFRAFATNATGQQSNAFEFNFTAVDLPTPSAPDAPVIQIDLQSTIGARVRLYATEADNNGSPITRMDWEWQLESDDPEDDDWTAISNSGSTLDHLSILTPSNVLSYGTRYRFRAFATNAIGKSTASNMPVGVPSRVALVSVPDAPAGFYARSSSNFARIFISSPVNGNGAPIRSVEFEVQDQRLFSPSNVVTLHTVNYTRNWPTSSSVSIGSIDSPYYITDHSRFQNASRYRVRARCTNSIGTGEWSSYTTFFW